MMSHVLDPPRSLRDGRARVVIIDDHPMVRRGVSDLLSEWPEFVVCGDAPSLEAGLSLIDAEQPDVVILDLLMDEGAWTENVRRVLARHPLARILVFTMQDERFHAARVLEDGARGYLMKGTHIEELRQALRTVAAGGRHVSARLQEDLLRSREGRLSPRGPAGACSPRDLTVRQQQVLHLLGLGHPVPAVAAQLRLSTKTVETHCSNIRGRLGLRTARELLCYAVVTGVAG